MYCSKECQEEHWESHEDACDIRNKRRAIYRAGKILQTLHYISRAKVFDENITFIETDGKIISICAIPWPQEVGYFDRIQTYPAILCGTEKEKTSFLVFLKCRTSIVYLREVIEYLLHGKLCFASNSFVFSC